MYGRSTVSAASQKGVAPTYGEPLAARRTVMSGSLVMRASGFAPFASSFLASVRLSILPLGTRPGLLTPVLGLRVQTS